MRSQNWSDVLKLLAMMILGGDKSPEEESRIFQDTALSLKEEIYPELTLTREMAKDWLDEHRKNITRSMSSLYFDTTATELLSNLSILPNKQDIVLYMIKITLSASDTSHNEERIRDKASEIWQSPMKAAV